MAFLKILINVGLIFAASQSVAIPLEGDSENGLNTVNYRLPDNVVPIHYDIKLIPHIEEDDFTFDGKTHVIIEICRATQNISLHTNDLTINETATSLLSSDVVTHTPTAHNYDGETEILTLQFDDELSPGIYDLNIQFVGILNNNLNGFFRSSYINEEKEKVWLAATHFEACDARRAFPCWDEPALKATFNISIKHSRNYTAVSNMPIWFQSNEEDDMIWTHFLKTPVMSTYLVAFVVSDYVRVPNEDETLNMWCRSAVAPYSKFAQDIAQKAREILTEYTNSTDKVPKMDHLAVPKLNAGAMENWGLIIYNEKSFTFNEEEDNIYHKRQVAITAAHEMAHQWFGNVVSPSWWSHVWLNEGLASFFQEYILNEIVKEWRVMDYFVISVHQLALHYDIAKNMEPITFEANTRHEIESLFSLASYGKAPAILRMLQHIITPEVFQEGIIKYLHKHQFSSASSDDLWSALQTALDKSDVPHNNYRLKDVMDTWLKQRHYPLVRVTRNYNTSEIIITQEHFNPKNRSNDSDKWWVPLTVATQTNPDFSNTLPTHWLSPQDENISIDGIDPNDWIIVNIQQMGFYRVNYDDSNWRKLATYLNSDNYTKIHVLNRVQIIEDAYHLMLTEQLDIEIFVELTNYLHRETDYLALRPIFTVLEEMSRFYKIPEINFLKQHTLHILEKYIEIVGYEEDPADDDLKKLMRYNTLKWACTLGHSECKRRATVKLNEILTNPETPRMSWEFKDWIYNYGIMEANASTWNKLMDTYLTNQDRDILDYLISSEDPDILINFINTSISNDSIETAEYDYIILNIVNKHLDKNAVFDYIFANYEKIMNRKEVTYNRVNILYNIITNVFSHEQLDKISDFMKSNSGEKTSEEYEGYQRRLKIRKINLAKIISKTNKLLPLITKEDKIVKQS
ncbi:glutamyl aminopeptidase [Solenopsis invicta]|uniref:glutamyl aminopeptidase n=1 Tax=Solenopsis invicta TaxID=13686 RepID=UPI000E33FB79|nr:glutamyl aminopeptidase [Solenopsis invicta]